MIGILVILGFAVVLLGVYFLIDCIYVNVKLKQHQKEWDCKLRELIKNGVSQEVIDEEFYIYMNVCIARQHPLFGACIPAKWSASATKEREVSE